MSQTYRLDNSFAYNYNGFFVTVVGCGGTGGYAAGGLCRLLPANATLVLIDHDRVEERNLSRQNFTRDELGAFKSEALAARLSRKYGKPVGYSMLPVGMAQIQFPGLVIGCVDNGPARQAIASQMKGSFIADPQQGYAYRPNWWIDAGNGENYGQIVIGSGVGRAFDEGICYELPLPTDQMPELLHEAPRQRNCADRDEQGPTINHAMASLVIEVARRLIEGTCPWERLLLDLGAGTLVPVMARD